MADVLLLHPFNDYLPMTYFPYAVLFLKHALEKNGHQARIIDLQLGKDTFNAYKECLLEKPDVLGISLICGPALNIAIKAAELCRKISPDTIIVWGGVMPSLAPEVIINEAEADYIIRFEGEEAFPKLVSDLENGNDPRGLGNLVWKEGDKVIIANRSPVLNLKDYPPIDFKDLPDEKYVNTDRGFGERVITLNTSRGCPYSCTFCYTSFYHENKWRSFPVEWVLDTIEKLVDIYKIDALHVLDDCFFVNMKRSFEIMEGMKNRGYNIKWMAEIRVDHVLSLGVEGLNRLVELGLTVIYLGIESGNDRILKIMNKKITVDDILKAVKIISQTKLLPTYSFIIGIPSETKKEVLNTIDLAMKIRKGNPRASFAQICSYIPWPGTPLYETALEYGYKPLASLKDWSQNYILQPKKMPWSVYSSLRLKIISYAAFFQRSDEDLKNFSVIFRTILKIVRAVFAFRLQRHVFFPFVDIWLLDLYFFVFKLITYYRTRRFLKM